MTLYAELGQALAESLNIKDERVTKKNSKINKKLNESINEEREMSYTPGFDAMVDLIDSGISENDILQEILRWLPDDTLAEMADDFRRQWDLDYFEESLDISKE